ncbi:MAG: hypothetical protein AAGA56_09005, partial [Myxococcota bacterium]
GGMPVGSGGMGGGAAGARIEVIASTFQGNPTSDVPGLAGTQFTEFDRIYGSPNGNWIMVTEISPNDDEAVLVNGTSVVAIEGQAVPFAAGETYGTFDTKVAINDSGLFLFNTNSSATTADEYLIGNDTAGMLSGLFQEGGAASPPLPAGATWGSTLESVNVLADGTYAFSTDGVGGLPTGENDFIVQAGVVLAQEGITVPPGQTGTETIENFDLNDFFVTPDGAHYLVQGDLFGSAASDDFVIYDGNVIVQEDVVLPNSGFNNPVDGAGIVGVFLAPNGTYFVRGNNDTSEIDWIYSNGAVLATLGDPITVGSTEVWDDNGFADCFFSHTGNGVGDYVLGGVTDGPTTSNAVLVLNGTSVLVREDDPVDLDGNGMFDDDAFISNFGNDDVFLTDAGVLFFFSTIRNAAGTVTGEGLFTIDTAAM